MTDTLIVNRAGECVTSIEGHGEAYLIGERIVGGAWYLVTPDTGHVWLDAHGGRCADLGRINSVPTLPADDDTSSLWEEWAAEVVVKAYETGVRID